MSIETIISNWLAINWLAILAGILAILTLAIYLHYRKILWQASKDDRNCAVLFGGERANIWTGPDKYGTCILNKDSGASVECSFLFIRAIVKDKQRTGMR
jgi:hypothetical protein